MLYYYRDASLKEAEASFTTAQLLNSSNALAIQHKKLIGDEISEIDKAVFTRSSGLFPVPIPHDIGHDPVLNIRHKEFYCESKDFSA